MSIGPSSSSCASIATSSLPSEDHPTWTVIRGQGCTPHATRGAGRPSSPAVCNREARCPSSCSRRTPCRGVPASFVSAGHHRIRYVLGVVALAAAYYGAAEVGYALDFAGPVAAILWLPVGVAIAFLALAGLRLWPGVLVGDLLANDYTTLPLGSALGQTSGNMLEVLVAALLIRRLLRRGSPLDSVGGLGGLLVALAAGTAISATVGPLSLLLGGVITSDELADVWRTWWLGDFTGALVVVPLAIAWSRPLPTAWSHGRSARGGGPARGGRRGERVRVASRQPADLPRLPAADLGRPSLRAARRHRGDRGHGRLHRLEHRPLRGSVLLPGHHPQRAEHAAVPRRRGARDAVPGRRRLRAGAVRRTAQRLPRAAGRGGGHRAPAPRAQPPRWGAAAPDRPRSSPAGCHRIRARRARAGRVGARGGGGRGAARDRRAEGARPGHPAGGAQGPRSRATRSRTSPLARRCRSS